VPYLNSSLLVSFTLVLTQLKPAPSLDLEGDITHYLPHVEQLLKIDVRRCLQIPFTENTDQQMLYRSAAAVAGTNQIV